MAITPILANLGIKIEKIIKLKKIGGNKKIIANNNQVVIVGFSKVGVSVANTLKNNGVSYIIVDNNIKIVNKFSTIYPVYYADITNKEFVKNLSLNSSCNIIIIYKEL